MAGVITTGSIAKLLWPGLNEIWGQSYKIYDSGAQWKQIFEISESDKNYEEDVALTTFGLFPRKPEGDATQYDTMKQGYIKRYTNVAYSLGYVISREAIDDNQYKDTAKKNTVSLNMSAMRTREIICANVLNRATDGAYLGGDNQPLLSTSHPLEDGVFSNLLGSVDLSEAAIEQALIDIRGYTDSRGNLISLNGIKLVVPRQLWFEANRILKNENRPETANRDINALVQTGALPGGIVVNNYLVDPKAWFIITDCLVGLRYFDRVPLQFTDDNDFDTDNLKYKAYMRFSAGWTDPRCIYGSTGA